MEEHEQKLSEQASVDPSNPDIITDSSLENSDTTLEPNAVTDATSGKPALPPTGPSFLRRLLKRFNVYLLLFILLVLLAGTIALVAYIVNHRATKPTIQTQSLTEDTLKQLADSDVTVGQPKQVLNVQSNAVFAGKVLIRDSLEVAGPLQVGGSLSLPGISVSGNSQFDQVQISQGLSVAGDSALQGQVSIQKGLSVGGSGTFGGAISAPQVTTNGLQLNGDLNLTHHITAGGATPGRSNGSALGSGGAASVSGSDTAGSVNINTGSGAGAGCFVTIYFSQAFHSTPHVLITPVGASAGGLGYYVNRTTTNFSICTATTPPSFASFGFDYFILD